MTLGNTNDIQVLLMQQLTFSSDAVSSVTTKGQVTVPINIRRMLGIKPYDKVKFLVERGSVKLSKAKSVTERTAGIFFDPSMPRLSARQERAEAEKAIAEEVMRRSSV